MHKEEVICMYTCHSMYTMCSTYCVLFS